MTEPARPGMLPVVPARAISRVSWLLCLLLLSCAGGTETGNPSVDATLSYAAYSSVPLEFAIRQPAAVAEVTDVWLVLGAVSFSGEASCVADGTRPFSAPGIGIGNHAATDRAKTTFEIEENSYCNVRFNLLRADEQVLPSVPESLGGRSILIRGKLADGIPFSIASDSTAQLSLVANAGGFAIDHDERFVVMGFDVAEWLKGIAFASATRTNGEILISPEQNASLLEEFEAALPSGVALFRDVGGGAVDFSSAELAHAE